MRLVPVAKYATFSMQQLTTVSHQKERCYLKGSFVRYNRTRDIKLLLGCDVRFGDETNK